MPTRYKKIEWGNLKGANQQVYDSSLPFRINSAQNCEINPVTGFIAELPGPKTVIKEDYDQVWEDRGGNLIQQRRGFSSYKSLVLLENTAGKLLELWELYNHALSKVTDFPADSTRPRYLCSYKDMDIAYYLQNPGPTKAIGVSTDGGATWTHYSTAVNPFQGHEEIDGLLYFWNYTGIYITTDGHTLTTFFTPPTGQIIHGFAYVDGEMFVLVGRSGQAQLLRLKDDGTYENKETINYILDRVIMARFDNNILIIASSQGQADHYSLYRYNASGLEEVKRFYCASGGKMQFLLEFNNYKYFLIANDVFFVNRNMDVILLTSTANGTFRALGFYYSYLVLMTCDGKDTTFQLYYPNNGTAGTKTFNYVLPRIIKRHIPAYMIISHDPLVASQSVTLSLNLNGATAFATSYPAKSGVGLTRSVISFKDLKENFPLDQIEFKITVSSPNNTTVANYVKNLKITYLYENEGLEKIE